MSDEEQRRIAAERKRAYRQRKRSEELARQANPEELTTMFNLQAHNIAPELEEAWKNAKSDPYLYPMPEQDHREQAQAIVSDAEERHSRVELIMANHNRIRSNPSELMWEILKLLNLMRIEMVDLLGGKK